MTQPTGREIVVDHQVPPLADRAAAPPPRTADSGPRHELAAELRASRDWRKTSLGASADLTGVDFSGEDLRGVDFSGASLTDAHFADAQLADTEFAWARLARADFTGASGLLGAQFARADLTGARVPSGVRFGAFETANEVAESTAKLLLTLLLVCAYSWLTINSTLDAKLITDTGASELPILNAQIPIVNFYALVPLALVGLSLVVMLQSQRLWAAVAASPAALPDGTRMADRAGAWILGPWAAERLIPRSERGFLTRLQARLAGLIGWWLAPATVAWFWARYLHRHDLPITIVQVLALTVGCTAAVGFLTLAHETLPVAYRPRRADADDHRPWTRFRPYLPTAVAALLVPLVFGIASRAAIRGVQPSVEPGGSARVTGGEGRPAMALQRAVPAVEAGIPELMAQFGMRPVAQLEEAEVSTRMVASAAADTGIEPKATGARLVGADLRFASAERVFLAFSDLRYADMLGADLRSADLRGSNLAGASMVGSKLVQADLRKTRANSTVPPVNRMIEAGALVSSDTLFCSRTSFAAANMRYARMNGGDFREAAFDAAMLQGATFGRARMTHATFTGADLDGADFRGAIGLTADQILAAEHVGALYDSTLLASLKARSPSRFAGYDAGAIAVESERERVSGEDDPDTLTTDEKKRRDLIVRTAYEGGAAVPPSEALKTVWQKPDTARGVPDPVPYGCLVTRVTRARLDAVRRPSSDP